MDMFSPNNIEKDNFQQICRCCLTNGIFGNIFKLSWEEVWLSKMFNDFLLIKVDPNDEMPKTICGECIDELIACYKFKKKFEESQAALKKILKKNGPLPQMDNRESESNGVKLLNAEISKYNIGGCMNFENSLEFVKVDQNENKLDDFNVFLPQIKDRSNEIFLLKLNITSELLNGDRETEMNKKIPVIFKCICGAKFTQKFQYMTHRKEKKHYKKYCSQSCKHCFRNFRTFDALQRHIVRKHTSENNNKRYINHRSQHNEKIHRCEYCKRGFISMEKYHKHKEVHDKKTPFLCEYCGNVFMNEKVFSKHLENHVVVPRCEICEKVFLTRHYLTQHIRYVHGEKKLLCVECGLMFCKEHQLKDHMRIHTGEKPYECSVCDKKFRLKPSYRLHSKMHTSERRFKCHVCSKKFFKCHCLKRHIKMVHTNERDFKCLHCGFAAIDRTMLKIHVASHTGENRCKVCNKRFRSFKQLREHQEGCPEEEKDVLFASILNFNE